MSVEKNILLSINVESEITYWHTLTGKKLHQIEESQFIPLSLDYNKEGSLFALGGDDKTVRIYDENMRIVMNKIPPGGMYSSGHIGRVNSVCFHKKDDSGMYSNILATGGGDQRVILYDMRVKKIIHTFSGPYIASDSVDMKDHYLLTGSYNKNGEVQLWDLRTFKLFKDLTLESEYPSCIQSVEFSRKNYLATGSGHNNSLKIYKFDCSKDDYEISNIQPYMLTKTLDKPCYTIHFGNNKNFVAFCGGSDYFIRVINL
jgi:COMPASS component SWD3